MKIVKHQYIAAFYVKQQIKHQCITAYCVNVSLRVVASRQKRMRGVHAVLVSEWRELNIK